MTTTAIARERLAAVEAHEAARFAARTPRSTELLAASAAAMPLGVPMAWMRILYAHEPIVVADGEGARFRDVDGNAYLDFNLADMSMPHGFARPEITRAAADRLARGGQFLLPGEDALWVAQELGRRFGLPAWQFTLSATQANQEAIRVARAVTGRPRILTFDGKYHGHAEELLTHRDGMRIVPEGTGLSPSATADGRIIAFNDLEALEVALADGTVACVLTEPALTNAGVIQPDEGYHAGLREITRAHGTLLILDETHTLATRHGGLTREWALKPDLLTMGKAIGGGVPIGAYGMRAELAERFVAAAAVEGGEIATGGTLFASALSLACARAALDEVLTEQAYDHAGELGAVLADGIEAAAAEAGLDWRAHRLYTRSGYTHGPQLPRDAHAAAATFDRPLYEVQRLFFANRGVWDAIYSAGPAVGFTHTRADVDAYLATLREFLAVVTAA